MIGRFESRKPFWEIEEESLSCQILTGHNIMLNIYIRQIVLNQCDKTMNIVIYHFDISINFSSHVLLKYDN